MSKDEIERHKIAAEKLEIIKNKAFEIIKRNLGKISEYEVNQFILSEFKKQGLIIDEKYPAQIVAVNENSSIVHYFPKKPGTHEVGAKIIKKNNLILIDIWARLRENRSPFADITWMGYSGKSIPKEINKAFKIVARARDIVLKFLRKNLKNKKLPKTKEVDKKVRDYFRKFSLEKYFLHGTGHSLGFSLSHGKYFRFSKKSKAKMKPDIPFTIEPGLYFKDKFGIRSEINCYITKNSRLIVTTEIQNEIIKI